MLGKTLAVVALAASCVVSGVTPGVAASKGSYPGWYDANATAAQSRANLIENVLSPSAVAKVKYLRSLVAPPITPSKGYCAGAGFSAPIPAGGYLYAVTSGKLSKYNPATGSLIWRDSPPVFRTAPPGDFSYGSVVATGGVVITSDYYCSHHANFPTSLPPTTLPRANNSGCPTIRAVKGWIIRTR